MSNKNALQRANVRTSCILLRTPNKQTQSTHRKARLEPAIRDAQKLAQNVFPSWRENHGQHNMALLSFFAFLAFMAGLWPSLPVLGLSDLLYNRTICETDIICAKSSSCERGQASLSGLSDFIVYHKVPCQISLPSRGCSSVKPHGAKTVFTRSETAT